MMWAWSRLLAGLVVAGCRVHDLDVTGKACPCPADFSCDPASNTCIRGDAGTGDDGAADAVDHDGDVMIPDLSFYFRLDEPAGTVAIDSSGHGGDGSVNKLHDVWKPMGGKVGGALYLDGTPYGSGVYFPAGCPTVPTFTTAITVAGWVNFDRFQTAMYSLGDFAVVQGSSGGNGGGWGLGATDKCGSETIGFTVTPASGQGMRLVRCGTSFLTTGTWYYLTGVYDGASLTQDVYINGVKENGSLAGGATPSSLFTPPACPKIGTPSNQTNVMAGFVDEVRIYDRALAPDEVMALFVMSGG